MITKERINTRGGQMELTIDLSSTSDLHHPFTAAGVYSSG
jgi:hypothetical protein